MKNFFILLIAIVSCLSCSLDNDDDNQVSYEFLAVESANLPNEFERFQSYEITLKYLRPTDCHAFNDIYFKRNINERNIAIVAVKFVQEGVMCNPVNKEFETTFKFQATQKDNYIFKFWQGKDENGEDIYSKIEVPVVN